MDTSQGLRSALLVAIGIAAVLVGCAPEQDDGSARSDHEEALAEALRSEGDDEGAMDDQHALGQQFLVECMAAGGFTYYPVPRPMLIWEGLGLSDREFKLQYGRGFSTLLDYRVAQRMIEPDDPNSQVWTDLSEAELQAYHDAMKECEQAMIVEIGVLPPGPLSFHRDSPLLEAIQGAVSASRDDPRIAEVVEGWGDCMTLQGFDYSQPNDLTQDLQGRTDHLEQTYVSGGQELVQQGTTWDELRVEDVLTVRQLEELRDVQAFELAVGAAEVVCLDRGLDPFKNEMEIQREYLQEALADF